MSFSFSSFPLSLSLSLFLLVSSLVLSRPGEDAPRFSWVFSAMGALLPYGDLPIRLLSSSDSAHLTIASLDIPSHLVLAGSVPLSCRVVVRGVGVHCCEYPRTAFSPTPFFVV